MCILCFLSLIWEICNYQLSPLVLYLNSYEDGRENLYLHISCKSYQANSIFKSLWGVLNSAWKTKHLLTLSTAHKFVM